MAEQSVTHATFAIERFYDATPAKVFAAWADPQAKARWFEGPAAWRKERFEFDFRVGGRERMISRPPAGPAHIFEAEYRDIVPDRRIVYCCDMRLDDLRISVSLATVEFLPAGRGTQLIFTEQGAFLDGYDDVAGREHGTALLLDKLDAALRQPKRAQVPARRLARS